MPCTVCGKALEVAAERDELKARVAELEAENKRLRELVTGNALPPGFEPGDDATVQLGVELSQEQERSLRLREENKRLNTLVSQLVRVQSAAAAFLGYLEGAGQSIIGEGRRCSYLRQLDEAVRAVTAEPAKEAP